MSTKRSFVAYNQELNNALKALEQIKNGLEKHAAGSKGWGQVSAMNGFYQQLKEIADQVNGTGEYSEQDHGGWSF